MKQNKAQKIFLIFFTAVSLSAMFVLPASAAGEDIFSLGDKIIRDVYTHIAGISTVLAALMTAVAVITMKFSGTQQKSDQAWDWIKRIWIAWVIINGIGAFIANGIGAFIAYITPLFDGYAALPGSTGSLPSGGGSAPAFIPDTGGGSSGGTGGGTAVSVSFLKYFT